MVEISEAARAKARQLLEGLPAGQRYQFEKAAGYIQQVSDAAKEVVDRWNFAPDDVGSQLRGFILPEPVDPLIAAVRDAIAGECQGLEPTDACLTRHLRLALARAGLKIVEASK